MLRLSECARFTVYSLSKSGRKIESLCSIKLYICSCSCCGLCILSVANKTHNMPCALVSITLLRLNTRFTAEYDEQLETSIWEQICQCSRWNKFILWQNCIFILKTGYNIFSIIKYGCFLMESDVSAYGQLLQCILMLSNYVGSVMHIFLEESVYFHKMTTV